MKKIFTLITMMVLAIAANAEVKTLVSYEGTATLPDGVATSGTTVMASVKINGNKTAKDCIQLKNGYTTSGVFNNNAIILSTEGGFKKGDVLSVTGYINNKDASKRGTAEVFTMDADGNCTAEWTAEDFINGYSVAADPTAQTWTLTKDMEKIYIGRNGGTGTNFMAISVTREESAGPAPIEYTVNANVWCNYDDNNYTKDFLGQKVKVAFNYTSDDAGTCDITLPAAVAGPCTMEEQTITGFEFVNEGNFASLNAPEGNFPVIKVKYNGQPVDMTVSFAEGWVMNGELDFQVIAYNVELGASVEVTYTASGIEIPTAVKNAKAANAENKVAKLVKNGKVVIVKDGKAYTVAGAAVK